MSYTQEQLKALLKQSVLKANSEYEAPPILLEIEGEYGNQIFATLGNFSTILARPKVGKTTLTAIPVSSILANKSQLKFIPHCPAEKKEILWIDSEQGKPECIRTIQFISQLVNGDKMKHPEHLHYLSFRQFNYLQRRELTEYAIKHIKNLSLVIIDGIRDFVSSINDEKEATLIADKLLKWTQEKNIHIITILHQNKGDANARGHLGTELMNKAETVAKLIRDETSGTRLTIIEPEFTRHKDFEPFAFSIDDNGFLNDEGIIQEYKPKSPKANELTHIEITEILKQVFPNGESYSFSKLQKKIHEVCNTKEMLSSFGMNKCSDLIKRMKEERFISQKSNSVDYVCNTPL